MVSDKPLNILHLSTHVNLGGISSYIGTLAKALSKKGHQNSVASSGGNAAPMLVRAGVMNYEFNLKTKSELHPKVFFAIPPIARLIREEGFDVLHAHTRVTQVLSFFLSKVTGVPYVSTAHGFYTPKRARRLFPAWGERVVAVSETVAEELEEKHGVPPERVTMIHNAIDLEAFERRLAQKDRVRMRAMYGIPKNAFVVGSLSRLVKDKGHTYLIEAMTKLVSKYPGLFLLIVGDGKERSALEKSLSERLPQNSRLVPGVADTTSVLCLMDVFAHPATFREGFGLSMAEAMVAGVPVIATDIPAVNTLIRHEVNGWMVEPKNSLALAEAVARLIEDPALAGRLSREGRKTALALCRPERFAEQMESVYREVLGAWKKS